ncbi:hypothetical protein SPRG_20722 [Saprolegnia parasitica CBS 223.65]|uniref:C2 domain-containing protein n=1 Tax=Saprolegnia parasitica (strain CBS 223.65) TaxID=695850 RepID=A0A067CEP6_SAPPC|nr:hypothetical protein SPRG_20722 [Saprolegnia parasitica CBS 223.65]KDO25277.1 hypothetical protein SPRG_20722 [Saprolegnia parasitica CBS 223.65]|eukprot:XP_012204016.1 hypothetical protein SPRG_20722 [Saprolegnia parasitica CBS 223.65]
MVLESFLAKIVNKFCSRFVKDFKKENLTISLSGDVCLSDFELNTDEIKDLQLPVELKSFAVGKLHINIPLTHLSTQSIKVDVTDVYVLLGTPSDPKWDIDALYVSEQSKIFILQLLLDLFSPPPVAPQGGTPSASSVHIAHGPPKASKSAQMFTPSVVAILRNASIALERVHVRFEDGLSGLSLDTPTSFALGCTIKSVNVLPSTQTIGSQDHVKSAKLNGLAIYFKKDALIEKLPKDAQRAAFRAPFDAPAPVTSGKDDMYLLEPLSADVSVQMTLPVAPDGSVRPTQVGVKLTVPDVRVNLAHAHYTYLGSFLDGVDRFDRFTLYRRFKPKDAGKGVKKNWRDYWRFAIAAVLIDLNDPVRQRPTWRNTLNLVLVGLQYTAIRRKVLPYLIRQPMDADHHFLQYREDFKHNALHAHAPYDQALSLTIQKLPASITAFGDGIYAGVYGLARIAPAVAAKTTTTTDVRPPEPVAPALSSAEAEAKELWHRQLCIDAMFRPVVVAKLRALAVRQVDHKQLTAIAIAKDHNERKGVLTVTLVDATSLSKSMHLFPKMKIGRKGAAYTGGLVATDTDNVLFSQTFEFHLEGTANEGNVHIHLFDKWPMFSQFVGKFRLPLASLTSQPHTDAVYTIEAADPKTAGIQLRVLTVFHLGTSSSSPEATYKTSHAMMEATCPEQYAMKTHEWHSWYTAREATTLQTVTVSANVGSIKVALVFPKVSTKGQLDHILLQLDKWRYQLVAYPMQAAMKQSFAIARVDVFHFVSSDTMHKQFIQGPKVTKSPTLTPFLQLETSHAPKEPLQIKLRTSEMDIVLDIPVIFRHVLSIIEKMPEITSFITLLSGPVYTALTAYAAEGATPTAAAATSVTPTSSPASPPAKKRSNSIFESFQKMFSDDDEKLAVPLPPAPALADDKDRSAEVSMSVDIGAIYVSIPSVNEFKKADAERIVEIIVPGTKLHIHGGRGLPTEVSTNTQSLATMTHDWAWVLGQFEKIGLVLSQQLKHKTKPFYTKEMASKAKVQRLEYDMHELEKQLAHTRCVIRDVVAGPAKYSIDEGDCDTLRMMVRDMQPKKVALAPAPTKVPYLALLQQGLMLLKHHVHSGEPQWRLVWTTEKLLHVAKLADRKKANEFPLATLQRVTTGEMTPALERKGSAKDAAKYVALFFKDVDAPLSFECQSEEVSAWVAAALQSLVP